MPLTTGTRLGPYEVLRPIGAGGMGEVYRAHDPRLGRDIAIKVLPHAFAADAARLERFAREARAVAALNHPHIVTIHSTEEDNGTRFMTMELVEGRSLDALIAPGGMPLGEFFQIAVPIADALTAAHQRHITHRDLKPANVMVGTDGRVKVLDFGLARLEASSGHDDQTVAATHALLTHQGMVVGTMPYMSPEQIEGRPLDARSDLFSLGVMFYEMLSGARPFVGDSSPLLMSAILRDTPAELSTRRSGGPDALNRLVGRLLEKRPDDRVQTARDVYNELRHMQRTLESGDARRPDSGAAAPPESALRVAVLPFSASGTDANAAALAEGLTEDITASLARFPTLSIVAQHATRQFAGGVSDVRDVAGRLGAKYVLSGQVRKSEAAMRIGVHLVDVESGAHLWSDTFNRTLDSGDLFALQDEVTDRVVATVADRYGVLVRAMGQALRGVPLERLSTRQLVLWQFAEFEQRPSPEDHARLRAELERRVTEDAHRADAWVALAHLYLSEYALGFNPLPDPLGRAMGAARRVIELDPTHHHGWEVLARVYLHTRDEDGFHHAVERAVQLNARDANTIAWMGDLLTHAGEYDRGEQLTARAMALNPHHPSWYHFAAYNRHISRREFAEAFRAARRVNVPELHWYHFAVAVAAGHLQRRDDAAAAVEAFDRLAPEHARDEAALRELIARWYWQEELVDLQMDGFRHARALRDADRPAGSTGRPPSGAASDVRTTAPGSADRVGRIATSRDTSIAVLPFSSRITDEESTLLADGLSEDIAARLSRFSHLRVIWEGTAARAARLDTEGAGPHRAARYLLEGSVRRGGASVRVTVRLVDTDTGAHLWAENYDRDASAGVFAIQDDITRHIVVSVGNASGVLVRAMGLALRHTPIDQLTTAELIVRFHAYLEQLRPDEHAELRAAFERAVQREPAAAAAWACLAYLYEHEHSHHFNPLPDPLARHRHAAERAVELNPALQYSWLALASAQFFGRDRMALRPTVERAVSINPLSADDVALAALYLECAGESDRAMELFRDAAALNLHHPGWYHFVPFAHGYRRADYEAALVSASRINMPLFASSHFASAAAAGQLGRVEEVRGALTSLQRIHPDLLDPQRIRDHWEAVRWVWDEELVERLIAGFEKAHALWRAASTPSPDL
jgi:TolB-like protein/tetratricopeptide (TPR) repeat protein